MALTLPEIQSVVKKSGLVPEADLREAVKTATHLEVPLTDVLLGRRLLKKQVLGKLLGDSLGAGFVELSQVQIPVEVLSLISEEVAVARRVVPFAREGSKLSVALEDTRDLEAIGFVKKVTGLDVVPYLTFEKDLRTGLRLYKGSLKEDFQELVGQAVKERLGRVSLAELAEDVSVVEAVNKLLEFAVVEDASDIHLETMSDRVLVRYRIDGVLHDMIELPKELHSALVARVKILAGLKLDETRLPQDGRMKYESKEGGVVSLRISILPMVEGEKIVMRLLEGGGQEFSLLSLGFDEKEVGLVDKIMSRPHGLILVTGPTGSGKTTTLYTMLGLLNTSEVNVSTVEDPVENRIRRVNQMQVNTRIKLGFADGLRSLLRQDPDVIMVGEIRDPETSRMAVNAAMTGHLVLSTLHTNDAPGAIPRIIDLGAEPFLVASTLELVIAQRLVRKVCPYCQVKSTLDDRWKKYILAMVKDATEKEMVTKVMPEMVVHGKGCSRCKYTGYQGRIGIFEMFEMDDDMRELVLSKAAASKIKALAISKGMRVMLVNGLQKVANGTTTINEVLRVTFG